MSFGHGTQDAQKTMGVIALTLVVSGHLGATTGIPLWVILSSAAAIAAGTYSGGWRIMRTLGRRIFSLTPASGFAAQTVASGVMLATAQLRPAGVDHARHHVLGDGRRRDPAAVGGALGRGRQHRVRLDPDDPGGRGRWPPLMWAILHPILRPAVVNRTASPGRSCAAWSRSVEPTAITG